MERIIIRDINNFKLSHTLECGQCFRWKQLSDEAYTRGLPLEGVAAEETYYGVVKGNICVATATTPDDKGFITLVLDVTGGDKDFWQDYFDLDTDYGEIKRVLLTNEPKLEDAIESGYGIRILNQDIFETLISFIISQNNNIARISKCIESLARSFGNRIEADELTTHCGCKLEGQEFYSFPSPQQLASVTAEEMNPLKLGYRSAYVCAAASRFLEDGLPESEEGLISYLGVGPKVANCIKLFGLKQMDSFPIDVWVKRIMNDMYGFAENDTKGMQSYAAEKFGRYGGYAQQYLFHYYRNTK